MTAGLEVFVQLVMAAITTDPLRSCWVGRAMTAAAGARLPATSAAPPSKSKRATSSLAGFSSTAKAEVKLCQTAGSGTRSWGRFGPATLGSTLLRSSSSSSLKTGVSDSSLRNIPCAWV